MTPEKGAETSEERPIDATELTPSTEVAASDPAHPVAIDADCEPTPTIAAESPEAAQLQGSRRRHRLLAGSALGLCSAAGLALSLLLLAGNANLPLTGNAALPGASPSGPNATLAYGTDVDGTGTPAVQNAEAEGSSSENAENAAPSESSSSNGGAPENGPSLHDDEVSGTSNGTTSADDPDGAAGADRPGSAPASGGASNAAGGQSGSSSAPASSSTSSDSSGPSNPSNPSPSPAPASIAVSVVVDSSAAASLGFPATMASATLKLPEGATAYDALAATGLSLEGSSSYVSAVNGLAEKMMGGTSGWTYTVNGTMPMTAASNYILHEGDAVRWVYVS